MGIRCCKHFGRRQPARASKPA